MTYSYFAMLSIAVSRSCSAPIILQLWDQITWLIHSVLAGLFFYISPHSNIPSRDLNSNKNKYKEICLGMLGFARNFRFDEFVIQCLYYIKVIALWWSRPYNDVIQHPNQCDVFRRGRLSIVL